MNKLRDVWRVMYRTYREADGPRPYHFEGLWVMPFETSANMAAQDAAVGLIHCSLAPGGAEHYPMVKEIAVFRMDCGQPVEMASVKVRVEREAGRPLLADGQDVLHMTYDGTMIRTKNGWKETD